MLFVVFIRLRLTYCWYWNFQKHHQLQNCKTNLSTPNKIDCETIFNNAFKTSKYHTEWAKRSPFFYKITPMLLLLSQPWNQFTSHLLLQPVEPSSASPTNLTALSSTSTGYYNITIPAGGYSIAVMAWICQLILMMVTLWLVVGQ